MTFDRFGAMAAGQLPKFRSMVIAAASHSIALGMVGHRPNPTGMSGQSAQQQTTRRVPNLHGLIETTTSYLAAIRAEFHLGNRLTMADQGAQAFLSGHVPNFNRLVVRSTSQPASIGAKGDRSDPVTVSWPLRLAFTSLDVPQPDRQIFAAASDRPSGLKAKYHTRPVCPVSVLIAGGREPGSDRHSRIVASWPQLANR